MSIQEQRSPAWFEMRRKYLGASDASCVMGINPYKSIYQLWLEKLNLIEPEQTNAACQRGIDLEPVALYEFHRCHTYLTFTPKVVFHPTESFLMASLDGINEEQKYILEIKCNGHVNHKMAREGQIPPLHYPQLMHQLAVTGYNEGIYFSFDGENGCPIRFERNQPYIDIMIEKEREFWHCVQNFIAPPMTSKDLNLQSKKLIVDRSDDEWKKWVEIYERESSLVKRHEESSKEAKEKLIELSQGKSCRGAGYRLIKNVRKGAVQYEEIPELQEVDLEKYRKKDVEFWKIEADS